MKYSKLLFFILITAILSCESHIPNSETRIIVEDHTVENLRPKSDSLHKSKKVYVPVYSNIYQSTRNDRTSLTSTLSIHNTSETDTLFITRIDYHNTEGKLVKKYLESPIYLNTFETIEYVVDEKDDSGGSGANFVIEWYGNKKLNPLFQAVMIGGLGSKSFSFTTEGVYFE
jgi:hypothetical protein